MKMRNLKPITLLSLVICFLLLAMAPLTNAQSLSLAVDPPVITINTIPPTTATATINIQNKGDTQITLQIQLKPFKAKGENGELEYSKDSLGIINDIRVLDNDVPVESITLGPQQQKRLSLSINIPEDASISDHYFSLVFVSTNSSPIESSHSISQIGIATNILLSVGPLEIPKATIEEFSTNLFFEKGPVPFIVRVDNSGNHLVKPKGEIAIKNMFGQNIGRLDLYGVNILSGSIRAIPNKDSTDFKRPTALWKESFLLGLYTATLNISMSNEGPTFTRTIYFFCFPLLGVFMIIAIAISAIVITKRLRKYMNKDRTKV